jgi:hypothetical protein
MQVSSQSWPNLMMTTRSSSAKMAWSTAHPECKCGSRYDISTQPLKAKRLRGLSGKKNTKG